MGAALGEGAGGGPLSGRNLFVCEQGASPWIRLFRVLIVLHSSYFRPQSYRRNKAFTTKQKLEVAGFEAGPGP